MKKEHYPIERFYEMHKKDFSKALEEIKRERKSSHWMWYIFPQLRFLGKSEIAIYYGIEDIHEARAFYEDSYLGGNLREICEALLECETENPLIVMGYPDNIKLCSCMTLFYIATEDVLFKKVIDKFYGGKFDELTAVYIENHQ